MAVNPRMPPTSVSVSSARLRISSHCGRLPSMRRKMEDPSEKCSASLASAMPSGRVKKLPLVRNGNSTCRSQRIREGSRGSYTPLIMPGLPSSRKTRSTPVTRSRYTCRSRGTQRMPPALEPCRTRVWCHLPATSSRTQTDTAPPRSKFAPAAMTSKCLDALSTRPSPVVEKETDFRMLPFMYSSPRSLALPRSRSTCHLPSALSSRSTCADCFWPSGGITQRASSQ